LELLKKILLRKRKKIIFDLIYFGNNDNIRNIFELHQKFVEKQKNYELIDINFKKLIQNLIDFYTDYNVKKLIELKKYYNEKENLFWTSREELKNGKNNLNEKIYKTGINLIKNKKLSIEEIVYFVTNDEYYNNENYILSEKRDLVIFENWELSEKNIDSFAKLKPWEIFKKKIEELYKIIINKIEKLDDIDILFKFFPIDKLNEQFIGFLLNRLIQLDDYTYLYRKDRQKLFKNINHICSF